jgi:hypothetical protein
MGGAMTFDLQIEAPHADPQELELLTLQLRRELLDLDDVAVDRAPGGDVPPGSKGVDPTALGALVVTLAQSTGLAALIHAVQGWLSASNRHTVRIQAADGATLEVVGASSADQRRLIDAWIDSYARQ